MKRFLSVSSRTAIVVVVSIVTSRALAGAEVFNAKTKLSRSDYATPFLNVS